MRIASLLLLATMILMPTASVFPEPQRDVPREMDAAKHSLNDALNQLDHAGAEWGGHRANAMNHIREALRELNEAERWAREHHDVR